MPGKKTLQNVKEKSGDLQYNVDKRQSDDSTVNAQVVSPETEFDNVLKLGTGFENGKERVADFYNGNPSKAEAVEFLKKAYGQGGRTIYFADGTRGYTSHDAKGIVIDDRKGNARKFSWSEVDERLRKLIKNGEYDVQVTGKLPANKTAKSEKTLFDKYNEVKQKRPDNIVLYRVGDFFEVIGEDAKAVAEWADLTLTSRNNPNAGRVPMVGFPYHKLESFMEKIREHQNVTLVQEENGVVKEYPMATLESSKPIATVSKKESIQEKKADNVTSYIEALEQKKQIVMERFGLTEEEAWAVTEYKTAEAYKINAKLREDETLLNAVQKKMVKHLDSALEKLPKHKGKAYRTVSFDDQTNAKEEYNKFLEEHTEGSFVDYTAYTSTSAKADGHPMPEKTKYGVTLEIECENGRDLDGFGNNFESEVLYPRDFSFVVTEVGTDKDGRPYIKVKEIGKNVRYSRNSEERGNVLQQVQAESSLHGDLQEVPRQDTARSGKTENSVQGVRTDKEGEIKTLKHSKSVYPLFKGANMVRTGEGIIASSQVAIPLTDEALSEIKKVVEERNLGSDDSFTFKKLGINNNDVTISGNPKILEKLYVFKVGSDYYICEQKYLDAFNNGENTIKANKDKRMPWAVYDKNGNIAGAFVPNNVPMTDAKYDSLQSVTDVLDANKAKKSHREVSVSQKTIKDNCELNKNAGLKLISSLTQHFVILFCA